MTQPGPGGSQTQTRDATVNLDANVQGYVTGMTAAQASTNRMSSAVDALDAKLSNISKRAGKSLIHFAEGDFAALAGATATAATFEKQLGTLNATAAVTNQSFAGIKGAVTQAFTSFPVSRTNVIALTESLEDLGVSGTKNLTSLIQTFIKLGAATGEGPEALAQGLVQLSRLMGQTNAQQIGNYANSLLVVSKNAGVSATGVLNFAQAIAPLARQAGIGEAAVLGISAAFSKAGADGYVAANTFNSIVSDITNLTQSGSPELSKYANLIGVTVKQFKGMDKTTALQDIFNTISKQGPAAINTLNRLGIDGVRAQSAIAAVVQSGGLNQAIAQAQGSSGNQKALNTGAKAAFDNLGDSLASLRNEFTQFGTEIGTTFLGPMTAVVNVIDQVARGLNILIKPLAPLIGGLGAVAGVVSGVAGAGLGVAGLLGGAALVSTVVKGGPGRAFRGGMSAGRPILGETAEETTARLAMNPSAVAYASRTMPLRARVPYVVGSGIGGMRAPIDADAAAAAEAEGGAGFFRQAGRAAVRMPFVAGSAYLKGSKSFMADARKDDYSRSAYSGMVTGSGGVAAATSGAETAAATASASADRSQAAAAEESSVGLRAQFKAQVAANQASVESEGALSAMGKGALDVAKQFIQLGIETGRFAVSLATAGRIGGAGAVAGDAEQVGALGAIRNAGAGVGRGVGAVAGGIAGTARGIGSALGPLGLGLIAASIAPTVISAINNSDSADTNIGGTENSVSKYDTLLNTTSTNLAQFGQAVDSASSKLNKIPGNATIASVSKVTPADVATAAGGYKVTDSNFATLAKAGKGAQGQRAAVSYIQGLALQHGSMSPKLLQSIKEDLLATYGQGPTQSILNAYTATGTGQPENANIDYAQLGAAARSVGGSNSAFKDIIGQGISVAQSQAAVAPGKKSSRAQLGALLNLGTGLTGTGYGASGNVKSFQAYLAQVLGGSSSDYTLLNSQDNPNASGSAYSARYGSNASSQLQVLQSLANSKQGKKFLKQAGVEPQIAAANKLDTATGNGAYNQYLGSANYVKAMEAIAGQLSGTQFPNAQASQTSKTLATLGPLGALSQGGMVQSAYNAPSNPALQYQAQQLLYGQASGNGSKGIASTDAQFDKLNGTIKDTSDQLYIMNRAAETYADAQAAYAAQFTSRPAQLQQAGQQYQEKYQANLVNPTADSQADLQTAQANYQQLQAAETSYEISTLQQTRAFGVQQARAVQDNNTQIFRSQRDFYRQQLYAQQDYQLQSFRANQDYQTQLQRQAESTAQTIYDPFARVQAQYTISASQTVQNLEDQNSRIQQQVSQLRKAKSMGVSQQAIDTLDLSNPNNAQELNNLIQSLMANPNLINQINKQAAARLAGTKSLTESSFSLQYRETSEDFKRSVDRASQDYNTSVDRAQVAQQTAMSDMAVDFNRMVKRSAQDLTTSMTELYGTYADNYGKTLASINNNIGTYAPQLAKTLVKEITAMQTSIDNTLGLTGGDPTDNGPNASGNINVRTVVTKQHARQSQGNAMTPSEVAQNNAKQHGIQPTGVSANAQTGTKVLDQSTTFSGPISIQADDLKKMQAELAAAARLAKLTAPPRRGG